MAEGILHPGVQVFCMHQGQATPVAVAAVVTLSGQPAIVQTNIYEIKACSNPPSAGGPCVTAQWVTAASCVRVKGIPILLQNSQALCAPTSTGVRIFAEAQSNVRGR
jgi:hypothetical protein